jgi:hypothetical protein
MWDGLDDRGRLAPPGDYRWKAVFRAPLHLKYEFTVNHAGTPPWLSGTTGGWLSDHCAPQSACAIGDKVFVGAQLAENGNTLIALDMAGRKLWGAKWLNLAGAQVLASDGKALYVGSEGGWIGAKLQVNVVDPATYAFRNVVEETYASPEATPQLVGLAVRDGKAYLALHEPQVIAIYTLPDADHPAAQRVGELPLKDPGGLAFDAQGDLWAVSGTQVVRFASAAGEAQPVIIEGLTSPQQLAFDVAGNPCVSDGAPSCQVKVFDVKGALLRTVGKPGGRKLGPYDPECMDNPQGIAVDAQGQLWVAENSRQPKRVSLWSRDGRLVQAFHGPTRYGGSGYLDATDRTRLHDDGMTFRLDWDKGTWDLTDVHYQVGAAASMVFERTPGRSWSHDGRTFLSNHDYWTSRVLVLDERLASGVIAPLAAAGRADGVPLWAEDRFEELRGGKEPKDLNFLWSDLNRDDAIQDEEVRFFQTLAGGTAQWGWEALWSMWITEDCGFVVSANGWGPKQYAWKLPVVSWQDNGAPVFDAEHPVLIADVERHTVPVYDNVVQSILADSKGRAILIANPITGCDDQGKALWTYENPWPGVHGSHSAPSYKPGMVIGGMLALGMAKHNGDLGEVFATSGNKGQVYLFTTDGLLVATLFADCPVGQPWSMAEARRGMLLDDLSLGEEHFGGQFTRTSDGRYYLVVGSNHTSIVQVAGMETLRRTDGGFSLDAATVARCEQVARASLRGDPARDAEAAGSDSRRRAAGGGRGSHGLAGPRVRLLAGLLRQRPRRAGL